MQNASDNVDDYLQKFNFGIDGGNNYKFQVDIYEGVDIDLNPITLNDDNPTSGKLVARLTQSFEYPITLNKPLKLQANKPFSIDMVMVKLNLLLFFQKSQNHIMICHLSNKTTNDLIL